MIKTKMLRDKENNKEFGICVTTRESESIESLLRRFKRKVTKSEILKEYRDHTEYLKPSVKKRKKSLDARRRDLKELAKAEKDMQKRRKKFKKGEREYENTSGSER